MTITYNEAEKVLIAFFDLLIRRAEVNPRFNQCAWDELSVCMDEFLEELRKKEEKE